MHPETDPRYRLYLPSSSVAHNRKNPFPVFQSQQSYSLFLHSPNFLLPPENLCITVVFPDSQKLLPEFHPQPLCPTGILSYRYKDNLLFQELLMHSVSHRYWTDDMVSMHKPHYTRPLFLLYLPLLWYIFSNMYQNWPLPISVSFLHESDISLLPSSPRFLPVLCTGLYAAPRPVLSTLPIRKTPAFHMQEPRSDTLPSPDQDPVPFHLGLFLQLLL